MGADVHAQSALLEALRDRAHVCGVPHTSIVAGKDTVVPGRGTACLGYGDVVLLHDAGTTNSSSTTRRRASSSIGSSGAEAPGPFDTRRPAWYGSAVRTQVLVASLFAVASSTESPDARGDVTSWLAVGGGYSLQRDRRAGYNNFNPTMTYTVGVGSSPLSSFVIGGVVRGTTFFGLGTDLGVALRARPAGCARRMGRRHQAGRHLAILAPRGLRRVASPSGSHPGVAVGLPDRGGAEFASLDGARSAVGGFAVLELDLLR